MSVAFKITSRLLREVHEELSRPHSFAAERVSFLVCKSAALNDGGTLILAHALYPVADEDYEPSLEMGAVISGAAFRKALQFAYNNDCSIFHIHRHEHSGMPAFSRIDERESAKFVVDFFKVRQNRPHGALVFSFDQMFGYVWAPPGAIKHRICRWTVVGTKIREFTNE